MSIDGFFFCLQVFFVKKPVDIYFKPHCLTYSWWNHCVFIALQVMVRILFFFCLHQWHEKPWTNTASPHSAAVWPPSPVANFISPSSELSCNDISALEARQISSFFFFLATASSLASFRSSVFNSGNAASLFLVVVQSLRLFYQKLLFLSAVIL